MSVRAKVRLWVAGAALIGAMGLASSAGAVAFTDGDFSNPNVTGNFNTYTSGQTFGAWTVFSGSIDLIGTYWQAPPSGGQSVDLDGNAPGEITQTFDLGPGHYDLSFFLSGNPDGGAEMNKVLVNVGGAGASQSFSYTTGGNSKTSMAYTPESLLFNLTSPETIVLSFTSQDASGAYGPVIGGVSINAVPEPLTWAMMLIGFAAVGVGFRLRRASPATAAIG